MVGDTKRRNLEEVDSPSKRRIHGDRSVDAGTNITNAFHGRLQLSDLLDSGKSDSNEQPKERLNEPASRGILRVAVGVLKCRACRLRRKHVLSIHPLWPYIVRFPISTNSLIV